MKQFAKRRSIVSAAAGLCLAVVAMTCVGVLLAASSPKAIKTRQARSELQARLRAQLSSSRVDDFKAALSRLAALDENGAIDLWQAALNASDPQLKREAWRQYQLVQTRLFRNGYVPQVASVAAGSADILRIAEDERLDATIWSSNGANTVVAAPPYLIDRLKLDGVGTSVLFDSIAEWQQSRDAGDPLAQAITPSYQSPEATSRYQVRVAVIDLANRREPAPGYSDWLGDHENVLMREGSLVAYLDIFESDGTTASIAAHTTQQYTNRGYDLKGFYTTEQFASISPRLFGGRSFNPGLAKPNDTGRVKPFAAGAFHTYETAQAEFKALAEAHPDLARYVKIGTSFEGRDIFALKITRDPDTDDPSKPDMLITGLHHAREWISVEPPMYFANQLIRNYATDDQAKYFVDNLQIWIVPIVNPDGLAYSQTAPNESSDSIRLWRKNRRPISIGSCVSSVGVDLNRNYGYQWRPDHDSQCTNYCSTSKTCINDDYGASDDPRNEVYRGPSAESEPEIRALKTLLDDPSRHFRAQLDYHNYSQLILYPWGYKSTPSPDAAILGAVGRRMSEEIRAVNDRLFRPEAAVDLYPTSGSSIDYVYGTNQVAAPFVVEMGPACCDFSVPESEIPLANTENWAGAKVLLSWAAGPPILESVQVYSQIFDGSFSKLIYSGRWVKLASGGRQFVLETRFPGIDPGRIQLRLQFSKTMNSSLPPRATLGRDSVLDELTLVATDAGEGWTRTIYQNDTWIGETVIAQDANLISPWRLAVTATDTNSLALDASPGTVASYGTGTAAWLNYEDAKGEGSIGGIDLIHLIGPTLPGDFANIFIASPSGGERLAGGDDFRIAWTLPKNSGFHPSQQELWLSTDSGTSYQQVKQGISGDLEKYDLTLPNTATTHARVRLVAIDGRVGNALIGDSIADFTIGTNVGSQIEAVLLSAEKIDVGWTDVSSDEPPIETSGSSRFALNLRLTNKGSVPMLNPFVRIASLNRGNVLLARDPKSRSGAGARYSLPAGSDNTLSPGESSDATLVVGLVSKKKFNLYIEVFGVPVGGSIQGGASFNVWSGKPKPR